MLINTLGHMLEIKKKIVIAVIFIIIAISVIAIVNSITERSVFWQPDYKKVELEGIINKETLTEGEYSELFSQTGLGKPAIDDLRQSNLTDDHKMNLILKCQNDYFSKLSYECRKVGLITFEERIKDKNGNTIKGFEVPSLKNGDVVITKSTHSIGWRHGHAAIITDASKGEILEAILLGYNSRYQNISKWQTYPSFILLRLKDENGGSEEIAKYAKENMHDIPYGLLTGILQKAPEPIKTTQCAHLVWYPYKGLGYDIDSDGSWLVTPRDIAKSCYFEIVQVYGVDPEEIWK